MRASSSRQRTHSGGTPRAPGAATRLGFGSVMPSASDGPVAGASSGGAAGAASA